MARIKQHPVKHVSATPPPAYKLIYKQVKFIEILQKIGTLILEMMGAWNAELEQAMKIKPRSTKCFGLFVKERFAGDSYIAFMKRDLLLSPKDCHI